MVELQPPNVLRSARLCEVQKRDMDSRRKIKLDENRLAKQA
jgi:hypothetical protein